MSDDLDFKTISTQIHKILDDLNLRLYDVHFNNVSRVLRIFIDRKEGGITISDCKKVSNLISRELDNLDTIDSPYTLEVSSPGIERPLKRPEHFSWAIGKMVKVDIGEKKIKGYLRAADNEGIVVAGDSGEEKVIPYASILKAKVVEESIYGKSR
jgi:ribosome maturation factor RimP